MDKEQKIRILENKVRELERFVEDLKRQQIKNPLDIVSQKILTDKVLFFTGKTVQPVGLLTANTAIPATVEGKLLYFLASEQP